jgi:succinate dehydrogenase / fumarate reductase iron-sulfur subunit
MQVTLKIFRYNPEDGRKKHYYTFTLEAEPSERILDLLERVKGTQDRTLGFRRSCAHGICGSDAIRINGVNRLACKVLVQDLKSPRVVIEPILGLPVEKDLIVDMEPFFDHYRSVMPYFVNDDPPPKKERLQSPEERERFDDTTKCILCAACTTSCPSFWVNGEYVGPSAIVNAHRFIFDSRERAVRGLPLPYHLQLHGCLPPRHPDHPGYWRGQESHHLRQAGLICRLTREGNNRRSSRRLFFINWKLIAGLDQLKRKPRQPRLAGRARRRLFQVTMGVNCNPGRRAAAPGG